VRQIAALEQRPGVRFIVRKQGWVGKSHEFDSFPYYDIVYQSFHPTYGGGTYNVYFGSSLLKTYHIPGEPLGIGDDEPSTKKRGPATFKQRMDDRAAERMEAMFETNPDLEMAILSSMFAKSLNIKLPVAKVEDPMEAMMLAEMESNPEYKRQMLDSMLAKRGIKIAKEDEGDELDKLEKILGKRERLGKLLGYETKPMGDGTLKGTAGAVVADTVGSLMEAIKSGEMSKILGQLVNTAGPQAPAALPLVL
jgi:hypothetical protein